jgi:hypothetical protein
MSGRARTAVLVGHEREDPTSRRPPRGADSIATRRGRTAVEPARTLDQNVAVTRHLGRKGGTACEVPAVAAAGSLRELVSARETRRRCTRVCATRVLAHAWNGGNSASTVQRGRETKGLEPVRARRWSWPGTLRVPASTSTSTSTGKRAGRPRRSMFRAWLRDGLVP